MFDHKNHRFSYSQDGKCVTISNLNDYRIIDKIENGIKHKLTIFIGDLDDNFIKIHFYKNKTVLTIRIFLFLDEDGCSSYTFKITLNGDSFQKELMKIVRKYKRNFQITKMKGIIVIDTFDNVSRKIKIKNDEISELLRFSDTFSLDTKQSIKIDKSYLEYEDINLRVCDSDIIIFPENLNRKDFKYLKLDKDKFISKLSKI